VLKLETTLKLENQELGNFYVGRFEVGKYLFKLGTSEKVK